MRKPDQYLLPPSPVKPAAAVALAALLIGAAWLGEAAYGQRQDALELQRKVARAARLKERPPARPPDPAQAETGKHWRALQAERDFAWYPVFAAVENAVGDDIELMEFEPDKQDLQIVLRGFARDGEALQEFIRELGRQPALREVYLSHQKNALRAGVKVLNFEMKADIRLPQRPGAS
ncbi:PilN domain-containing protein [Massilia sp. MB5]|uniref:PilN domain-containing protein n=1 Tax=unclassified Massilia TaxID=2609279 RepID=UPI00067BEE40|nr:MULTISPECIES: PilN domain-containing protein [unclassified Massilia]AKU20483.1 hypothetical protein ACZ75_02055 [Massilia sp. NR 4-1]UMR30068.1 PilN domain-containing protein [Massilia sp. MB5]